MATVENIVSFPKRDDFRDAAVSGALARAQARREIPAMIKRLIDKIRIIEGQDHFIVELTAGKGGTIGTEVRKRYDPIS